MGHEIDLEMQQGLTKLIPTILDELASNDPERLYGELPISPTGYEWRKSETVAFIGPNDMSHIVLTIAAIKTGYTCLLVAPNYGTIGQAKLIQATSCKHLLVSPLADIEKRDAIVAEYGSLTSWTLPRIADFFDVLHESPYTKNYEEVKHEPLVLFHTSGTSGCPKPIVSSLICAFYTGSVIVFPPALMPISLKAAVHVTEYRPVDCISFIPANIEELATNMELQDALAGRNVHTLYWGGAPLSQHAGDTVINRGFNIQTSVGSTETGMWYPIRRTAYWGSYPWNGMCFHPDNGIEFRPVTEDLYAAIWVKNKDPERVQPVFALFPTETEFDAGDLFRHVSGSGKDSVWSWYGRQDDLLVFRSGGKWHPAAAQRRIMTDHRDLFDQVLIFVSEFKHVAVLVEPSATLRNKIEIAKQNGGEEAVQKVRDLVLDRIWPTMEDLDRNAPLIISFDRSRIIFTECPMPRTAKGTVQRKAALQEYESRI
ncbi:NRPS-like enzyme [Penicillium angulare]|uniref:NRPS-like enzyme n=1 Tax=Penicillium angulare TaxID=116970 RepID=UPI0025410450|nr:NRPS-like enzyme [Penicillium angulare]KAJ5289205.1 NRPS-like enzyme [Penicillium angulare]